MTTPPADRSSTGSTYHAAAADTPTTGETFAQLAALGEHPPFSDPFTGIESWLSEAFSSEINDANAMALATVSSNAVPDVRMVLLKRLSPNGLEFYTNSGSSKGQQLAANPNASALFHWKSLRRQVRVRGAIEMLPDSEADKYFATRSRGSQIASTVSQQSSPVSSYENLVARYNQMEKELPAGAVVRPEAWCGYLLKPNSIEFWRDGPYRMHRRWLYARAHPQDDWRITQLQP